MIANRMITRLFRSLIILSSVTYLIFFFHPYYTYQLEDLAVSIRYTNAETIAELYIQNYLPFIILFLYIVSAVLLFFFIKVARLLFVLTIALGLVTTPVSGFSVLSGWDSLLSSIGTLCDGAVLYMLFFSSVAERFRCSKIFVSHE